VVGVKIAWVTHRDLQSDVGGAEAADREMLERRPEGVEVMVVGPGGIGPDLKDQVDKVIATGFYGFGSRELNELGRLSPVLWIHDTMFSGHWIMLEAPRLILLTPQHMEYELQKNPMLDRKRISLNPGHMDTEGYEPGQKEHYALWAHRPTPGKGLDLAAVWSEENDVPLVIAVNRPREDVRQLMSTAEFFVLLSHDMDPGPRAVMEAQLSGCGIIVNELVGMYDEPPAALRKRLDTAAQDFWEVALN
jgi:glycosyltransferase involved in cell wall biosynthesis